MVYLFIVIVDQSFDEIDVHPALKLRQIFKFTIAMTKYFVTHSKVQELLKSTAKFDLVISGLVLNEALLGEH